MMTTYTRRGPGQAYLKDVLSERINSLIAHKDLNLEINPLKVSRASALKVAAGAPPSQHGPHSSPRLPCPSGQC